MTETPQPQKKDTRGTLLVIEGVFIILLVLFSGFLASQNQKLTKMLRDQAQPTVGPTPTASPSPSPSLLPSPSSTPKNTATPTPVPLKTG